LQDGRRVGWPWQDKSGRFSALKAATFALMFAPALWLAYQVWAGTFGRGPLGGMTYWSGVWATALLLLALAVTPLATLFRWRRLILVRRMIGLTALVYSLAHLVIYFALRYWDFAYIGREIVTRLSLIVAVSSTAGLIALGMISSDAAIRRLGAAKWQRLQNNVYLFTALAVIHYLLSPSVYSDQYLLSGIFVWLMGWRVLKRRGRSGDITALLLLTIGSSLFTALFEAFWVWAYYDFEAMFALENNFTLAFGVSPAFKVLIAGTAIALGTAARRRFAPAAADAD
jgi:methionine sulfoxide reductase heme-binding subunit